MSSFSIFLLLIGSLWALATVVLALHRLHPRTGLTPLMIFLGGIAAAMQLQGLGAIRIPIGYINLNLDGVILLPVLLLGVLVVYIVSGTVRGRSATLGVILVSGLTISFQILMKYINQADNIEFTLLPQNYPLHYMVTSILTLALDILVLFLTYQSVSNLNHRYPSYLASGIALLVALLVDAVIFPILAFRGTIDWLAVLESQLVGKIIAGLVLWPLLSFYLYRVAPTLPDSVATSPRPVLDFFTTTLQLELRARYHYNLLRTLSQINQLIIQSTDVATFLQQTCDVLVDLREYHVVWIGTLDEKSGKVKVSAKAGFSVKQIGDYMHNGQVGSLHAAGLNGQAKIVHDVRYQKKNQESWGIMIAAGCRSVATFPMRYTDQVLGILNIGMDHPNSLGQIEIDLLQELADDLAYALISLEARNQQDILQTAAETMQDGLIISDLSGNIIYTNPMIAEIVGKSSQEMVGDKVNAILPPELEADLPRLVKSLMQKKDLSLELIFRTPDHRKLNIAANASIVSNRLGQAQYVVATFRDNTQWRNYEQQLLALNRLSGELVQIHDTQTLMEAILKTSEELLDADASGIYIIDLDTKQIVDTLTHNLSQEYSQRIKQNYSGLPGDTSRQTLQPAFIEDTLQDETYGDRVHFMAEYGIRALIVLPVIFQEQPLGALTLYYFQPHTFTTSQLQIGRTLAQTLAINVQNARLYQAEQEQRKLAEALIQATASLNTSLDLEIVLDQILEQVMKVIPCEAANVLMIQDDHIFLHRHRGYEQLPGQIEKMRNFKIPFSTPSIQHMLATEKAMLIPDTTQDPNWVVIPEVKWIRGYAGVPLKIDGEIVGFLSVDTDKPNLFTEETTHWLQFFTDHAATAFKNAQLFKAEHSQRELAEALAQAAASVNSSLELDDVLDHILEQAMRVLPFQALSIMTIEGNKAHITRHRGYENYLEDTTILADLELDINWPTFQELYQHENPVVISDTVNDSRWMSLPETSWIRSYIGIPLKVDQQVVGFLNIDSDKPNFFTEQDSQRLRTFADYASTAIKNARAYERSRHRAEEMAALVTAASAVSKNLDFMQVLRVVAEQMTITLKVKACAISEYDPETNQVTLILEHKPDDWDLGPEWYEPYNLNDYPLTQQVLQNNVPIHLRVDDPDIDASEREFMEKAEIGSLLMLPLVSQDRTIGLVELMDTDKKHKFSVREIGLALSLASHAAIAIENADLYRRLQDHAAELEERVQLRTSELQEATDYIEGILASVPDAVFVLNQDHQLVQANQSGQRLLDQAQATGLDLFNPQLLHILERGEGPNMQSILEVQERAYQALSSQLITVSGTPGGQIIVFRDVTAFRELDQMKSQFVSDVSHELRTPLTNLTLYLGLLTTVQDSQKQSEYILTLQRETDRLTHLIEDLLTISRLEASRIQFHIRATDLNQLTSNLTCDRAILAAQKGIELDFTPATELPPAAADVNMLTQAISNLLTNAINYTLPGGNILVTTAQPEPDWITIQITDTGVGIHPDEMERVFDRFYRGSASQQTGAEGTGLGLAIAQEIVHRLDGKITLETTPGNGSTFTIWLKLAPDDML